MLMPVAAAVDSGSSSTGAAMGLKPVDAFLWREGRARARVACVSCGGGALDSCASDSALAPPSPSPICGMPGPAADGARDGRVMPGMPSVSPLRFRPAARVAMAPEAERRRPEEMGADSVAEEPPPAGEGNATEAEGPRVAGTEKAAASEDGAAGEPPTTDMDDGRA